MTAAEMAAIHAAAMITSRPWSEDEITALLDDKSVFAVIGETGFALGRVVLDEAELLTLAVQPEAQGAGHGTVLLAAFEAEAADRGAATAFLEVAHDNTPARALYARAGWQETGRRKGYYARAQGPATDALVLRKSLT